MLARSISRRAKPATGGSMIAGASDRARRTVTCSRPVNLMIVGLAAVTLSIYEISGRWLALRPLAGVACPFSSSCAVVHR